MNLTNTCQEHYMSVPREERQSSLLAEEQNLKKNYTQQKCNYNTARAKCMQCVRREMYLPLLELPAPPSPQFFKSSPKVLFFSSHYIAKGDGCILYLWVLTCMKQS